MSLVSSPTTLHAHAYWCTTVRSGTVGLFASILGEVLLAVECGWISCSFRGRKYSVTMTTNIQQGTLLDVLKKKMRQTKEDMEKYKDECEEFHKRLQVEVMRREEVSTVNSLLKYTDD